MILDRPNHFGQALIVCFGCVKIIRISPEKCTLNLTKMIWTQPKQIAPVQNDWYSTKMIWTVQNHFGPIEGQGIRGLWIMWIYEMLKFDN